MLPSDDPAGGIHIETDANIPSPSRMLQLIPLVLLLLKLASRTCIDLGTVQFLAYYQNVEVGRDILPPFVDMSHTDSSSPYWK